MRLHPTLIILVALASCAEPFGAPSSVNVTMRGLVPIGSLRGGLFTASYKGSDSLTECNYQGWKKTNGSVTFSGSGSASYLGRSTEAGSMFDPYSKHCPGWVGPDTWKSSKNHDAIYTFTTSDGLFYSPCSLKYNVSFEIEGGVGKFAHAAGSGTGACSFVNGKYGSRWKGTISF